MKENLKTLSSSDKMTNEISALSLVESFLDEYYLFRRNLLSGKTEYLTLSKNEDETEEPVEEEPETGGEEEESSDLTWKVLTPEAFNSIVRHAKRLGVGGKKSPRQDIEEFVRSEEVPEFDPIREYLENLPEWDGKNHVAELFGRIPGLTSEQLGWCATWLRSAVAHWLQMDMFHGNETTPVLIGKQGCGKSTFAYRLLPDHLRQYFLDHINFANKFDSEMALTHNLFVNIDEFANMGPSQQGKLKQMLSKVKVNGRPIFGKSQDAGNGILGQVQQTVHLGTGIQVIVQTQFLAAAEHTVGFHAHQGLCLDLDAAGQRGAIQSGGRVHARVNVGRTGGDLDIMAVVTAIHLADVQVGTLLGHTFGNDTHDHLVNIGGQIDQFLHLKAAVKELAFQFLGGDVDLYILFQPAEWYFHSRLPPLNPRTASGNADRFQTSGRCC